MPDPSVVLYMPRRFRAIGEGTTRKMPLEILALAGPLIERGYKVKIIDANVQQNSRDLLLEACREPACLGISCILGYQVIDGSEVAAEIRRRYPDLPIIWRGSGSPKGYSVALPLCAYDTGSFASPWSSGPPGRRQGS